MLKISAPGTPNHSVTLKLEGRVVGPWVEELRRVCEPILTKDCSLKLDLAEVSYVDAEGVAMLNGFKARGVKLKNCSPFVEQQIKTAN
jgi:ABC-type transporter Mla MlaB component